MTSTQAIILREQLSQDHEHQLGDRNHDSSPQTDFRQWESKRTRASVLAGNALLNLPIWGFAMSYGVFQEYYSSNWTLKGNRDLTGIVGTTTNGVMYLSMPFLFALFSKRWARYRQTAALCGALLTGLSFLLSSFSTEVWHLIVTQGIMAAFGCTLVYSPTTLSLGEWFTTSHRAVAYGVVLSCKNIVGSVIPFLLRYLLDKYDLRVTLRIWAGIALSVGILATFLVPAHPSSLAAEEQETPRSRRISWSFLRHQTFFIYSIAIVLQSAGYGIPQTYLNTYAHDVAGVSQTSATLLLALFNLPGILACTLFSYLSDNNSRHRNLSATTVTCISGLSSALSAFLLWGLTSRGSFALLVLFAMTFGFFAGGYSSTWGSVINELEAEAARNNEAIDLGMLYGMLNGARGIGYVSGGLVSLPLLKAGAGSELAGFGYGTMYGPLIIFTGLSSVFGGWGVLWKWRTLVNLL